MIVLDASIVVELLMNGPAANSLRPVLAANGAEFLVPHLLDIEVVSAFRRMTGGRHVDPHWVGQMLQQLAALPVQRYPHEPLLGRIWQLRHNFTAYDAAYIALAEATDSVLYTSDSKLCKGHRARTVFLATPPV